MGTEIYPRGGARGRLYLTLLCYHHNDSCIIRWAAMREIIPNATLSPPQGLLHYKVGSDESPFNVLLTVRDKVTRQHPEKHNF